uniref:Uncharacterized protein n=1 Tax=Meloidogyne enterolobii TaxID=390850 RepID=A0A6V7XK24_MELEN|nr:unnamed protein product [Meloidogyne enterolobii]
MLLCPINNGKIQGGGIRIIKNKCLGSFQKRRIKIIVDVNGWTDFNVMKMNEK